MKLFVYDTENLEVTLDRPWVALIPEFNALIKRDKGSAGDYDGRKKAQARRELVYIYFYTDFASPIRDWEDAARKTEAMYYAGIENVDEAIEAASTKYEQLQLEGSRSLRSFRALQKTLDALDTYFEDLDFSKKDNKGELLNSPLMVASAVEKLDKVHNSVKNFEKRVEDELKQSTGIRGKSTLSEAETKKRKYSEEDVMHGSELAQAGANTTGSGDFKDLAVIFEDDNLNPIPDGVSLPG